jgi:hypothetical protein
MKIRSKDIEDLVIVVIVSIIIFILFLADRLFHLSYHKEEFLIVVLLGFILGYGTNRYTEVYKRKKDKKNLLSNINDELNKIMNVLTGTLPPNRLHAPIWDSAIASGLLRLLSLDQMKSLAEVYNVVKDVDEDAKKVKELYIELQSIKPPSDFSTIDPSYDTLKNLLNKYASNHKLSEAHLHEKIKRLLMFDWWKT